MATELRALIPARARTPSVTVPVAPGELLDKISILAIKAERISDESKLGNVRAELELLCQARVSSILDHLGLKKLTAGLRSVNQAPWDIEDEIRCCERGGGFGREFFELVQSVYKNNDRRGAQAAGQRTARLQDRRGKSIPCVVSGAGNVVSVRAARGERNRERHPSVE